MASISTKYYNANPEAKAKKASYRKKYNAKPSEIKRRTLLNADNKKRGTYGNGDKLDVSHKQSGGTKLEAQAKNRARNRGKAKG
jgi:hypothetical protein